MQIGQSRDRSAGAAGTGAGTGAATEAAPAAPAVAAVATAAAAAATAAGSGLSPTCSCTHGRAQSSVKICQLPVAMHARSGGTHLTRVNIPRLITSSMWSPQDDWHALYALLPRHVQHTRARLCAVDDESARMRWRRFDPPVLTGAAVHGARMGSRAAVRGHRAG
jgi:hypothetical protein